MGRFLNWLVDVLLALVAVVLMLLILGTELNFGARNDIIVKVAACAVLAFLAFAAVADALRPEEKKAPRPRPRGKSKRRLTRARGAAGKTAGKKKTPVVRKRTKR